MSDLNPEHHLVYAAQALEQADQLFWRYEDADENSARYLVSVAQAHAAIASAIATVRGRRDEESA